MPAPRVALLDVNVLVALFDQDHVHHELAHDWFADHRANGWATCPVTENGFVRVVSNPAYGLEGVRPEVAVTRLRTFCGSGHHVFWPDTLSMTDADVFRAPFIAGSRQLTDIYLLGLAVHRQGCLATFDRSIPVKAVAAARPADLQVIGPAAD
jgi:hypothetical protein